MTEADANERTGRGAGTKHNSTLEDEMSRTLEYLKREQKAEGERLERVSGLANADSYFYRGKFVALRMVKTLEDISEYVFGFDEERGMGKLMFYSMGVFRPAIDVERVIQQLLGESLRESYIKETIAELKRDVPRVPWDKWNRNRLLINCSNGMLDPVTLKLEEHSLDFYSTFQLPVAWNPEIQPNRVDTFLRELLPAEESEILLEIVGYLATCEISAKHFFVLLGPAYTGKTALLTLIQNLIGTRNTAIVSLHDLADNRFASASLENKLLAIYDDIGNASIRNSSVIKALTGKFPTVRIEHKGVDAYSAPLYARLLFTCNAMPECYTDKSEAWINRPLIVAFKNVFVGDRVESGLADELAKPECLERFFYLGVTALQRLKSRKMQFSPTRSILDVAAECRESDDSVMEVVKEWCTMAPEKFVAKVEWLCKYQEYCARRGYRPLGRNKAYERLLSIPGVSAHKVPKGKHVFKGITMSPDRISE